METIQDFLNEMKIIQENVLNFLDDIGDNEYTFQNLLQLFEVQSIQTNHHKLRLFLRLIEAISSHHHRNPNFFNKIERIIDVFKDKIKTYFTNYEIYSIFEGNKRLLLFFFEEQIICIDINIVQQMLLFNLKHKDTKYLEYFAPEIKPFIKEPTLKQYLDEELIDEISKDKSEIFYEKRKIGENDNYICEIIRKDMVVEFITNYNKGYFKLEDEVKESIFETNSFLFNDIMTLIEYAAFFGSIQIVRFMFMNGVELPNYLWSNAIYSNTAELIHFLEDNHVNGRIKCCFERAIKCHHNDIVNYFQFDSIHNHLYAILKSYNFLFMQNEDINQSLFCYFCKYDYYLFVDILLKSFDVDLKQRKIILKALYEI